MVRSTSVTPLNPARRLSRGAGDRFDVGCHLRQCVFAPSIATVVSAEDLPLARAEIDLLRGVFVDRDTEGRADRVDAFIETAPGFTLVGGLHHTALLAPEVEADAGVKGVWIVGRNFYTAGILDVRELF